MEKYKSTYTIISPRFTRLFASVVILIGSVVLIGWFGKLMFLTRFSINEVPMAPSTAYVFIFIAIGLWFYLRPQNIAINRNTAIISTTMAICISFLLVTTNILNYYSDWEHLFITIPETQLSMKLGHMSLVTGILFIISGFALLCLQSKRNITKTFSIIFTLIIFIISFILLLGYGFGAPFFYFDNFIPPAVLTVLSFLLTSLALLAASDKNTFFLKTIWNTSTSSKLLRIFLPTTIAITVIESLIVIRILPLLNIHPAIGVSVVSLIFVLAVIIVISILSKSMGKSLDSALENLSESEAKFKTLITNNEEIIYMIDKNGIFQLSEGKGLSKLSMKPGQVVGESVFDLYKDYPEMLRDIEKTLKGKNLTVEHKIGDMYFSNWYTPHKNSSGEIIGLLGLSVDITEPKQVEEKLRKSEKFSKEIIEAMSDGFSILDKSGVHIDVNLAFCKMTGFSKEELIGVGPPHPYWPEEEFDNIQAAFVKTAQGNFENFELVFKNKNGKRFPVLVHPSQIKDEQGNVISNFATIMDITERKKTEEALLESQRRYSKAQEMGHVGNWEYDPLTTIFWASDEAKRIYGLDLDLKDYTTEDVESCIPERVQVHQALIDLIEHDKKYDLVFDILTADKRIRKTIHSIAEVDRDSKGNPIKITGVISDITESKRAEEALRRSEEQLRIITDNLPVLISQVDKNLKYTFVNQYYYHISENQNNIIGEKVIDIIGEETFKHAYPQMQKALSGELVSFENNHRNKNNKLLILETHYIPYIVNEQVESFFVLAMDITERKLAEEALRKSEAKLNALFTSLTEMVVMHELVINAANKAIDYRIIDCNKVFTEFTGISKEAAVGKLASEVYQTHPPPYLEEFAKVGQGGTPIEFTTFYQPFEKHLLISVVSPETGKFATISTDISDMMQIQEMIMAKNKEMENYLYIASHDLRTPLVNIQGFSQRLKKQADSIKSLFSNKTLEPEILHQLEIITDEDIPKTLSYVLSSIEKMDALINGLLQLSRTGRVEMNIQKIDINALFTKILQRLDFQIKEAQCKIHVSPLPPCYGDAELLDQLFANIISNALKYADSERTLEITVDAKKKNNRVVYAIRDTGKGMAQKYFDKIWDIFYRIDPRSGKSGDGIGLSLVKRISDKHKGKVWVESEENKGSEFFIELNNRKFTEF